MENIEEIIKKEVEKRINNEIDQIIADEIQELYYKLTDMKDKYIADIMSGIRITHEQNPHRMSMDYRIIFENVTRIESK